MILDSSNGGFNGVTKDFYTTDLRGGEVVRRDLRALQGGYVIPNLDRVVYHNAPANVEDGFHAFKSNGFSCPNVRLFSHLYRDPIYSTLYFYNIVNKPPRNAPFGGTGQQNGYANIEEATLLCENKTINISVRTTSFVHMSDNPEDEVVRMLGVGGVPQAKIWLREKTQEIYSLPSIFFVNNKKELTDAAIEAAFKIKSFIKKIKKINFFINQTNSRYIFKQFLLVVLEPNNTLKITQYFYNVLCDELKTETTKISFNGNLIIDAFLQGSCEGYLCSCGIGFVGEWLDKEVKVEKDRLYFTRSDGFKLNTYFYTIFSNEENVDVNYDYTVQGYNYNYSGKVHYMGGVGLESIDSWEHNVVEKTYDGKYYFVNTIGYNYHHAYPIFYLANFKGYETWL